MKKPLLLLSILSLSLGACSHSEDKKAATTEEIAAMQAQLAKINNPAPAAAEQGHQVALQAVMPLSKYNWQMSPPSPMMN